MICLQVSEDYKLILLLLFINVTFCINKSSYWFQVVISASTDTNVNAVKVSYRTAGAN